MTYNVIRYVNMGIKRTELIRKIDLRKGKNKWGLIGLRIDPKVFIGLTQIG